MELRAALLHEMHKAIDSAAEDALGIIGNRGIEPVYPPGVELSNAEVSALANITSSPELVSAFRKVLRDTASRPLFQLFALLDGVADPSAWDNVWTGAHVVERSDESDEEMWHDDFFASYWDYDESSAHDV